MSYSDPGTRPGYQWLVDVLLITVERCLWLFTLQVALWLIRLIDECYCSVGTGVLGVCECARL